METWRSNRETLTEEAREFSTRYLYKVLNFLILQQTLLHQLDQRRRAAHQGFDLILTVLSFSRYGFENIFLTKQAPANVEQEKGDLICEQRVAGERVD
jgi:hypothetical protein